MKDFTLFLLVVSYLGIVPTLVRAQVAETFTTPSNCNNTCSSAQKQGWDWSSLSSGPIESYDGFAFSGLTVSSTLTTRDLSTRASAPNVLIGPISATSGPSFSSGARLFSVDTIDLITTEDTSILISYTMPGGAVCKQVAPVTTAGVTIRNAQCGGAASVSFALAANANSACDIGIGFVSFDCNPSTITKTSTTFATSTVTKSAQPTTVTKTLISTFKTTCTEGEVITSVVTKASLTTITAISTKTFVTTIVTPKPTTITKQFTTTRTSTCTEGEVVTKTLPAMTTTVVRTSEIVSTICETSSKTVTTTLSGTPLTITKPVTYTTTTTRTIGDTVTDYRKGSTTTMTLTTPSVTTICDTRTVVETTTRTALPTTITQKYTTTLVSTCTEGETITSTVTKDFTRTITATKVTTSTAKASTITSIMTEKFTTTCTENDSITLSGTTLTVTSPTVLTLNQTKTATFTQVGPTTTEYVPVTYTSVTTCTKGETVTVGTTTTCLESASVMTVTATSTPQSTRTPHTYWTTVNVYTTTTTCPAGYTTTENGYTSVIPTAHVSTAVYSVTKTSPVWPIKTSTCPSVLPRCINTWLADSGCSNPSDSSCYCQKPSFTTKVFSCIVANGGSQIEVQQAASYFRGICNNYVNQNPAIVTAAASCSSAALTYPSTAVVSVQTVPNTEASASSLRAPTSGAPAKTSTTINHQSTRTLAYEHNPSYTSSSSPMTIMTIDDTPATSTVAAGSSSIASLVTSSTYASQDASAAYPMYTGGAGHVKGRSNASFVLAVVAAVVFF